MTRKRSEKRRRQPLLLARVTPEEKAVALQKAQPYGSIGAMIRALVLNAPAPRSKADLNAIAKINAALGDIRTQLGYAGNNLNQIAWHLNAGRPGDLIDQKLIDAIEDHARVLNTLEELRLPILQALGRERSRKPPESE